MLLLYISLGAATAFIYTWNEMDKGGYGADQAVAFLSPPSASGEAAADDAESQERDKEVPQEEQEEGNAEETEEAMAPGDDVETPQYTYQVTPIRRRLMIRSGPSLDYRVIGYLYAGDTGDVIDIGSEDAMWALLTNGEVEGYSYKKYLILTKKEEP